MAAGLGRAGTGPRATLFGEPRQMARAQPGPAHARTATDCTKNRHCPRERAAHRGLMLSILEVPTVRQRVARISVETYHTMSELGLVDERTELLRGAIVEKMTKSPLHEFLSNRIYELARAAAEPEFTARKEGPLTLVDSEPEPDVAVVGGRPEDYRKAHPASALLAVEVSVSTEAVDREKAAIYAEAGVAEFWLVLPASRTVEVYSQPERAGYRKHQVCGRGETVGSIALPRLSLAIDTLFD